MLAWRQLPRIPAAIAFICAVCASSDGLAQTCENNNICINLHFSGLKGDDGNGNFAVISYVWGLPAVQTGVSSQLTFEHYADVTSSSGLFNALADGKIFKNGVMLEGMLQGMAFATHSMTDVVISAIQHNLAAGDASTVAPIESVTISFKGLDYVLQPVNSLGQKNGAPYSRRFTFP